MPPAAVPVPWPAAPVPPAQRPPRRWSPLVGLAVGLLGLLALFGAYALGTAPYGGPDEGAHLAKAVGLAHGSLAGRAVLSAPPDAPLPAQFNSRIVRLLPAPELPPLVSISRCFALRTDTPATCSGPLRGRPGLGSGISAVRLAEQSGRPGEVASYVAPYQPVPYVLPGLAARLGSGHPLLWARFANALQCAVLLVLALAVLRRRRAATVVLLTLTPIAASVCGTVNSSGPEITGAVLLAAVTAVFFADERPSLRALVLLAAAGLFLAWTRPVAPIWVLAAAFWGAVCLVRAPRPPRHVLGVLLLVAAAATSGLWSVLVVPAPHASPALHDLLAPLHDVTLVRQYVGELGAQNIALPAALVGCWVLATLAVLVVGVVRGRRPASAALAVLVLGVPVLLALLQASTQAPFRYTVQTRYVAPLVALAVVLAWVCARRGRGTSGPWWLVVPLFVVGQLVALGVNAHRFAVGTGGSWADALAGRGEVPAGGWPLLAVLAVLGVGSLAVAVLLLDRATGAGSVPRSDALRRGKPAAAPASG